MSALLLAAVAIGVTDVEAQDKFEVGVFAGSYRGASVLIDAPFAVQQQPGPIVGLRGTYWIWPKVGVSASAAYASSDAFVGEQFPPVVQNASVVIGTATAIWRFADIGNAVSLAVRGGAGVIGRNGSIWDSGKVSPTTSLAGVLGGDIRIAVASWMALSLDGEVLLYEPTFTIRGQEWPSAFQIDPVLSLGASTGF